MLASKLNALREEVNEKVLNANTAAELAEVRNEYLSKKGKFSSFMVELKNVPADQKPAMGQLINETKNIIATLIDTKLKDLQAKELEEKLNAESIDVTLPGVNFKSASKHPMNIVVDEIIDIFLPLGYTVVEGPEVEYDKYAFEMLNLPKGHPARDAQDSFYITEEMLLRPHTSPVQVRSMLKNVDKKPFKLICPGKVYRRDDDATHSHQFTQIEGLVVGENISLSDLKGTLEVFAKKMFGEDRKVRFRASYFPFTEPSYEVDVSCFNCGQKGCSLCKGTGWIEILGSGMVHPNVLEACGFDHKKYTGFAFGVGIERVAMLKYGITDIRLLYANDYRFLKNFDRKEI